MELDGRSAIVTGGAGGLGAATVRRFVESGLPTVVFDRDSEGAARVADELGDAATAVGGSVLDDADIGGAIEAASALGQLSVLVNVAGGGIAARTLARDGTPHPLDEFEKVVSLNLFGSFNVTRLFAARIAENEPDESEERGVVIHTASIAAFEGQIGQVAYAAAKGGLVGMTLPMARDLAAVGIRVCTIAPGIMGTPLAKGLPTEMLDGLAANAVHPHRLGEPDEFAALVEHIVRNPYLNGTTIRLDAGTRFPPR